jgi:hemoglobin
VTSREARQGQVYPVPQTIYESHGGFASVRKVVSSFYDRVLDSEILAPYFAHTDMKRLVDHQTRFVSFLLGGPASYSDDHLERVHARMKITAPAFDEMVLTMTETLEDHGYTASEVAAVEHELRTRQSIIVTA